MPLYDCLLLLKSRVDRGNLKDLVAKVGRHIYSRNGVLTDIKSFGTVQLGYGIKKLDGRHYQGQLAQVTMMVPPNFPKELHYLNKEDRLLRWLVVKHRGVKYGIEFLMEEEGKSLLRFPSGSLSARNDDDDDDESDDEQGKSLK
uniref:37S ribosomal protein MRP17, mitochondrial n=1 Tax=Anthurium amnicola TaxID=1678845 RepID=A0A1D1YRX5_9ARAE